MQLREALEAIANNGMDARQCMETARAALASAPAAETEIPVSKDRLQDALSEYWDAAYQEGKEGRDHDTKDGRAQKAWEKVMRLHAAQASHPQAQLKGTP